MLEELDTKAITQIDTSAITLTTAAAGADPVRGTGGDAVLRRQGVWLGFREGVLHDYLRRGPSPPVPAAVAHMVFREALTEAGYPEDLVSNYYAAVKTFNS